MRVIATFESVSEVQVDFMPLLPCHVLLSRVVLTRGAGSVRSWKSRDTGYPEVRAWYQSSAEQIGAGSGSVQVVY